MARFLVIEGLDGSGKSTQVTMLGKYLESIGKNYRFLHFPRLEEGVYGKLIARFLRGEMGDISEVDPYLIALIFAGDRLDAKPIIDRWLNDDILVIVDRYVYSNIAFQAAKISSLDEQKKLADWILELEYRYHKIPKPDINIFLDVPFHFTVKRLTEPRVGDDRKYLKGKSDIHEQNLNFQERVRKVYKNICDPLGNLAIINCADELGKMRSPDEIFGLLKMEINLFIK